MPLMLDLPPNRPTEVRTLEAIEESPSPIGAEGLEVHAQYQRVMRHWFDRSQADVPAPADEDLGYRHVPLKTVGTIRVRFKPAGRLTPRQFMSGNDAE